MLLLERAKKTSLSARERNQGINDNLSNPEMLKGLITVVTGSCTPVHGDSFKKNTSQYRKCEISGNTYIPFNDSDTILAFDRDIKENYADVVRRMIGHMLFLNDRLDTEIFLPFVASNTAALEIHLDEILCHPDLHLFTDEIEWHRIFIDPVGDQIVVSDGLLFPHRRLIRLFRQQQHKFLFFGKISFSAASGAFLKRRGVDDLKALCYGISDLCY